MANSIRTLPRPSFTMSIIRARRPPTRSLTSDKRLGGVDDQMLDRFVDLAVDLAGDRLRPRHLKLVPLAPHRLDQDREVQLPATGYGEDVRLVGRLDPQGEVRLQLPIEPLLELSRGRVFRLASGKWRRVHAEGQFQRRLLDVDHMQRVGSIGVGQRGADADV